jgi:hypothetical protein
MDPYEGSYQEVLAELVVPSKSWTRGDLAGRTLDTQPDDVNAFVGLFSDDLHPTGTTRLIHALRRFPAKLGKLTAHDGERCTTSSNKAKHSSTCAVGLPSLAGKRPGAWIRRVVPVGWRSSLNKQRKRSRHPVAYPRSSRQDRHRSSSRSERRAPLGLLGRTLRKDPFRILVSLSKS